MKNRTRQQVLDVIRKGGNSLRDPKDKDKALLSEKMPPWEGRISEAEAGDLADLVLKTAKEAPVSSGETSRDHLDYMDKGKKEARP